MKNWYKFILFTFPIYLVFLATIAEFFAHKLKDIPMLRHDTDKLAAALEKGNNKAEVAILGDSITYDILKTYKIDEDYNVANLTTNLASGLIGGYFIIKRYLDHNNPIQHLIIASTPEFYSYEPEGKGAEVYLFSVFQKKDEVSFLEESVKNFTKPKRELAILNLENKIFYKLGYYFFGKNVDFNRGKKIPNPNMVLNKSISDKSLTLGKIDTAKLKISSDIKNRAKKNISMSPSGKNAITKICDLSEKHNFKIHILRSPIPKTVVDEWRSKKIIKKLNQEIAFYCPKIEFFVTEDSWNVPDYAMRDSDHLIRPNWSNFYALILKRAIDKLF